MQDRTYKREEPAAGAAVLFRAVPPKRLGVCVCCGWAAAGAPNRLDVCVCCGWDDAAPPKRLGVVVVAGAAVVVFEALPKRPPPEAGLLPKRLEVAGAAVWVFAVLEPL